MRELELAGIDSMHPTRPRGGLAQFPLSRAAFIASIAAHVLAGYALSSHVWPGASLPPPPTAEFFLFEMPAPRPPEAVPVAPPVEPVPEAREEPAPPPAPVPRAVEGVPEPTVVVEPRPAVEPAPSAELAPSAEPALAPRAPIDFDEERRRAANQVVESRAAQKEYLTFSMDDLVAPRPEREPEKRSIFDGTGASSTRGPTVGQLGQARTKFGHKVSALCNALTGGFSVLGFGSFCAGPSDSEPSGLYPEVRPAYLDLMPECVDTRDTAPELAREAPFPTVKCHLVKPDEIGRVP
jgi:hypothetical protein